MKARTTQSSAERRTPTRDPFRYGWRYVKKVLPNGEVDFDQVPLTLEDILHPEEEDFRVHNDGHNEDCRYLKTVLKARFARRKGWLVLSDHRVAWGVKGIRPHGPDLAVFRNVPPRSGKRPGTFYVAKEGAEPMLVIEITSPETRWTDLVAKVDHYYRAGIPCYVIVDELPGKQEGRELRLLGYRPGPRKYERLEPDERGWLWLEPVGLWIGVQGGRAVCYDRRGVEVGDYDAVAKGLTRERKARRQSERARQQAEQARQQAEEQLSREASARQLAEERLREMEAELRRLRQST